MKDLTHQKWLAALEWKIFHEQNHLVKFTSVSWETSDRVYTLKVTSPETFLSVWLVCDFLRNNLKMNYW